MAERSMEQQWDSAVADLAPETIRQIADQAIQEFRDATVREFVPILAYRNARARLQVRAAQDRVPC